MELAPAKINLYLHICGKRADGYHLVDSLMAPLAFGDRLSCSAHHQLSLTVKGSSLAEEPTEKNLVMKAARALQAELEEKQGADILLEKHTPQAAGLGGGSSDAATTMKALLHLWKRKLPQQKLIEIAAKLGADVPFFLNETAQYAEGIGEKLTPVKLPMLDILLVNPGVAVPTADVFRKGFSHYAEPAPKHYNFSSAQEVVAYLKPLSNDLTPNAISIAPQIGEILSNIETIPGCMLARMSGSGATCFGIFDTAEACKKAEAFYPQYWTQATHTL